MKQDLEVQVYQVYLAFLDHLQDQVLLDRVFFSKQYHPIAM